MENQIKKIREKLAICSKKILDKEFLEKLLKKFAPSYNITDISRKKLVSPLKRGKYYINNINKELENPYEIIKKYFEGEKYMFGGLEVYNMYGFTDQVAEWYTVYNTKVAGKRIIGKNKFIFIKQRDNFFYGCITNKNGDNRYNIMSPERAFIQMIKEGKEFKILPKQVNKEKLLKMAKKYASKNLLSKIEKLCI